MAVTKPLIFDQITIEDDGGGTAANFSNHLVDSAKVTLTPTEDKVDDGQTLNAFYDVEFEVGLYDDGVLSDGRVYTDTSAAITKGRIVFSKSTGATTLTIDSVIINGRPNYEGNRVQAMLKGSKRGVAASSLVAES